MSHKIIAIGCDHAGYPLKDPVKSHLEKQGYTILDFGTSSEDSVDYPDFVHPTAEAVESGKAECGIIICGSGNGVAITANKHQGIRAALCWLPEIAGLAKQHNNANIISLPARFVSVKTGLEIVDAYLKAEFEGGRHQRRVDKIPC